MKIIDGKNIANKLNLKLEADLKLIKSRYNFIPCLAVILVGNNKASEVYVRNKEFTARKVGIKSKIIKTSSSIGEEELLSIIKKCNGSDDIDGLLVQLPLPDHINPNRVIESINPEKDVDGFHPKNIGLLALGRPNVIPCTPYGCFKLLEIITSIEGKNIIIIGRSSIVGRPLSYLLTNNNATVTLVHSKSKNINKLSSRSDILVAAIGKANMVKKDWIKPGAIVLDVGINSIKDGKGKKKLVGDVDFENVYKFTSMITPVPGGVGPMTIHCLLENTVRLALLRKQINYKFS